MQKFINFLAVTSFLMSSAVVAGGAYVYVNREGYIEGVKRELTDAVKDLFGTSELGSALIGAEFEEPKVEAPVEIPGLPF